jgi:hypothetical protein
LKTAHQEREASFQRQQAFKQELADVAQASEGGEARTRAELESKDQLIAQLELGPKLSQSTHTMDLDIIRDKIFNLTKSSR